MKNSCNKNRRDFIKTVSIGTAGILVSCSKSATSNQASTSAWTPGKKINPSIDNLRVVCCHDHTMINGNPQTWDMKGQNAPVNAEKVYKVLDEMATALASKGSALEAWQAIFQKPSAKNWKDVRAAIKVNCISENHPRVAVVAKACEALHSAGVPYEQIIIYDGDDDASKFYAEYIGKGLPAGVVVSRKSDALGGMIDADVPDPYAGKFKCTAALARGEIDILVNCAVNKGHNKNYGETTLTLKNHAGTFDPQPIHKGGGLDYIIAINKSNAILGGTPVRQQLCIVDSLWAMTKGPFGTPDKEVCRLIMGTFGPAVDYLTAKKVREPVMGVSHDKSLERFLTDFGYTELNKLDIVSVNPPA